jgi:hypothetical protein
MRKIIAPLLILILVISSCWKNKSPEDLPRLKASFRKQVETFEKDKNTTNNNVTAGLESLSGLQAALAEAKNEDKEFAKVYGNWEKVDKRVKDLNKEYEDLKSKAEELFTAMEDQTNSLADAKSKADLSKAIRTARSKYNGTLVNTSKAIGKLRVLHTDAVDVVKALEVAVALNSFDNINAQLESIEGRVDGIMQELNVAVEESKKLYDQRIEELN